MPTEEFPHNPNGSVDAIAGLVNKSGNVFGHMAHPEVSVYGSTSPQFWKVKDDIRREGRIIDDDFDIGHQIIRNVVEHVGD